MEEEKKETSTQVVKSQPKKSSEPERKNQQQSISKPKAPPKVKPSSAFTLIIKNIKIAGGEPVIRSIL